MSQSHGYMCECVRIKINVFILFFHIQYMHIMLLATDKRNAVPRIIKRFNKMMMFGFYLDLSFIILYLILCMSNVVSVNS